MFAKCKKILDRSLELLVTVAMTVLVLDVVWQVFTRYVLNDQSSWTEELATFLMIWVVKLLSSIPGGLRKLKLHWKFQYKAWKM